MMREYKHDKWNFDNNSYLDNYVRQLTHTCVFPFDLFGFFHRFLNLYMPVLNVDSVKKKILVKYVPIFLENAQTLYGHSVECVVSVESRKT
jgi:hypothetical protein